MSKVIVLYDGYSKMCGDNQMAANCSCTLIKGEHNIVVDTMTAWDMDKIVAGLLKNSITPDMISYVISTHGHSDHIGNNNLFTKAKHVVGFSVSFEDQYFLHPFDKGEDYKINSTVTVIPTPGHTLTDVSVIVKTISNETVVVAGDLFEKIEDVQDPRIWQEAGSEDSKKQKKHRCYVASLADWIVPGHGPMFKVDQDIRKLLEKQMNDENI